MEKCEVMQRSLEAIRSYGSKEVRDMAERALAYQPLSEMPTVPRLEERSARYVARAKRAEHLGEGYKLDFERIAEMPHEYEQPHPHEHVPHDLSADYEPGDAYPIQPAIKQPSHTELKRLAFGEGRHERDPWGFD